MKINQLGNFDFTEGNKLFKTRATIKGIIFSYDIEVKYLGEYNLDYLGSVLIQVNGRSITKADISYFYYLMQMASMEAEPVLKYKKFKFWDIRQSKRFIKVVIPVNFNFEIGTDIDITYFDSCGTFTRENYKAINCRIDVIES